MTPYYLLTYDLERFPFPDLVTESLGVEDLTILAADLPRRTWQTDQQSPWHAPLYAGFEEWYDHFDRFVREWIAPILGEPCYYQRVPTFRIQLPGNLAVGEFHTDAQYHHPIDEVSFWLPLTPVAPTSTVWVADDEGMAWPVNAQPGEVAAFEAAKREHGNVPNTTGRTRVSFDFRLLPVRCLPRTEGPPTKHTGLRFIPGGYYAEEVVG